MKELETVTEDGTSKTDVSVPLRGKGFESLGNLSEQFNVGFEFQSPCGEKVLKAFWVFRDVRSIDRVSVPLRGKGFESLYINSEKNTQEILEVSVPLREKVLKDPWR